MAACLRMGRPARDYREVARSRARADHARRLREAGRGAPVVRVGPRPERNRPCPCGSGEKYKRCCGRPS